MCVSERPRRKVREKSPAVTKPGLTLVSRSVEPSQQGTSGYQVELPGRGSLTQLAPDNKHRKLSQKRAVEEHKDPDDSGQGPSNSAYQVLVKDVQISEVPLRVYNAEVCSKEGHLPQVAVRNDKWVSSELEVGSFFRLKQDEQEVKLSPHKEELLNLSKQAEVYVFVIFYFLLQMR